MACDGLRADEELVRDFGRTQRLYVKADGTLAVS
jgi:hypothetical protein